MLWCLLRGHWLRPREMSKPSEGCMNLAKSCPSCKRILWQLVD